MAKDERQINLGPQARACPVDNCSKPAEAAHHAVTQVFNILGVDVNDPVQVEKFRQGLRFGEAMHRYAERGMMTMVGVITAGLAVAAFWGIAIKVAHTAAKIKGGQ